MSLDNTADPQPGDAMFQHRALDAAIRVGIVVVLAFWCFSITQPFLIPAFWGVIIAIGVQPLYSRWRRLFGNHDNIAATTFTLVALVVLLAPAYLLARSAVEEAQTLATQVQDGSIQVPPPPARVVTWPVIGQPLDRFWSLASENLEAALQQAGPQLRDIATQLLSAAAGFGYFLLQLLVSIVIAGFFLAQAQRGRRAVRAVASRLTGARGEVLVELAGATIRSVFQGVLGVAIIQATAAGLGLLGVGVPAAGLWATAVLIVAVIQLSPLLILGPIVVYVFSTASTGAAIGFLVWCALIGVSDTILKPIFLGRGVDVPMLVILIGAIGGLLLHGIIGLFVGAVVLAVSFELTRAWLSDPDGRLAAASAATAGTPPP